MASPKIFITGVTGYIGGDALYALNEAFPDFHYTALVRNSDKGAKVAAQYPKIRLVYGDLDDSKLLEEESANADLVVHTADASDHEGAARAISAGLVRGHATTPAPAAAATSSGSGGISDLDPNQFANLITSYVESILEKRLASLGLGGSTTSTASSSVSTGTNANPTNSGSNDSSKPGFYIHISGTGILTYNDTDLKRLGEAPLPDQVYEDWEQVRGLTGLPDHAFHRNVDQVVLKTGTEYKDAVKTAIVCPPTIYGFGRGPDNSRSKQAYGLAAFTLKRGKAPIIGAGKTEWDNVHVHDLSALIVSLTKAALVEKNLSEEIWGPKGYFLCANEKPHVWSQIAKAIAKEAKKQDFIENEETETLDEKAAMDMAGFQALSWGLNSRGKAVRANKVFGWTPKGKSLEECIPEIVLGEWLD